MGTRFRLMLIGLGTILIVAVYTFPFWFEFLVDEDDIVLYPELSEEQLAAFEILPESRQQDYLALRDTDPNLSFRMVTAALEPPTVVPDDEQQNPEFSGQQAMVSGEFITITPNRSAEGTATIYELPDGDRYLWLEDFNVINGPSLRLFLSVNSQLNLDALDLEAGERLEIQRPDVLLDPLQYTVGNQAYDIPREINLDDFNSILIYSTDLELVYSLAELR